MSSAATSSLQTTPDSGQHNHVHLPVFNVGTTGVELIPYEEHRDDFDDNGQLIPNRKWLYQSISCQQEYRNFSIEELRVADYTFGNGSLRPKSENKTFSMSSPMPQQKNSIPNDRRSNGHLDLLRGPGFEICVGESDHPNADNDICDTWCLPQALISHYSPFMRAACSRDFKEKQDRRIELPEQDPRIFSLFVEWMYYGDYEVKMPVLEVGADEDVNVEAQCWVLGDFLQCPEFKNRAMTRLYVQHTRTFAPRSVSPSDVQFACDYTAPNSKLRQFYFHFVVTHLPTSVPLKGTKEEWDKLLLSHTDAMAVLLQGFRAAPQLPALVKNMREYLDHDESLSNKLSVLKLEGTGS